VKFVDFFTMIKGNSVVFLCQTQHRFLYTRHYLYAYFTQFFLMKFTKLINWVQQGNFRNLFPIFET